MGHLELYSFALESYQSNQNFNHLTCQFQHETNSWLWHVQCMCSHMYAYIPQMMKYIYTPHDQHGELKTHRTGCNFFSVTEIQAMQKLTIVLQIKHNTDSNRIITSIGTTKHTSNDICKVRTVLSYHYAHWSWNEDRQSATKQHNYSSRKYEIW